MADAVRLLEVDGPLDLVRTLRPLADGGGDPTWRFSRDPGGGGGRALRAMWTPDGAATVELHLPAGGEGAILTCRAWGPGADWVLQRADAMAGLHDDRRGFRPELHPVVAATDRRMAGVRMGRALTVGDVVVPIVLGQRVTTGEARRSWWRLVWRHGHAAPGAAIGSADPGSTAARLPPTPHTLARLGDADWHVLGVERGRADAVRGLLAVLPALERAAAARDTLALRTVAESVRGVGPWTSTAMASAVLGDPDVVLLGDLHLPHAVGHALADEERGSDERMLELLEPFRPHRGRVVRLLKYSGQGAAPRRGPRYTPLPIAEM